MKFMMQRDFELIANYLGRIMRVLGVVFLIPLIFVAIFKENLYLAFIIPSFFSIGIGTLLVHIFKQAISLHIKRALLISALTWLWAALIGTLIMMIAVDVSFINGYFENMSAWTGTGLTMFTNVESLPYSILFLRSLEQWVGGLGIVVICISIFVKSGGSTLKLYLSEARDERLRPSIRNTMEKIMIIYLIITGLGIIAYLIVGVPLFDAINITFASFATGGMSIKNANIGYYNSYPVYIITMILMVLSALSFSVHFRFN